MSSTAKDDFNLFSAQTWSLLPKSITSLPYFPDAKQPRLRQLKYCQKLCDRISQLANGIQNAYLIKSENNILNQILNSYLHLTGIKILFQNSTQTHVHDSNLCNTNYADLASKDLNCNLNFGAKLKSKLLKKSNGLSTYVSTEEEESLVILKKIDSFLLSFKPFFAKVFSTRNQFLISKILRIPNQL